VAGARTQSSASGLSTAITQLIVLPSPVLAGWLVHRFGYGAAFNLAASFMAIGILVMLPVRLYGGHGRAAA